jgi:hypothetical protein
MSKNNNNSIKVLIELVGQQLINSFNDWLEANKNNLHPRLYNKLRKQLRKVEVDSIVSVIGTAMWMFQILGNVGVGAGIGPYDYVIQYMNENIDRKTTERLLLMISTALKLQYIRDFEK